MNVSFDDIRGEVLPPARGLRHLVARVPGIVVVHPAVTTRRPVRPAAADLLALVRRGGRGRRPGAAPAATWPGRLTDGWSDPGRCRASAPSPPPRTASPSSCTATCSVAELPETRCVTAGAEDRDRLQLSGRTAAFTVDRLLPWPAGPVMLSGRPGRSGGRWHRDRVLGWSGRWSRAGVPALDRPRAGRSPGRRPPADAGRPPRPSPAARRRGRRCRARADASRTEADAAEQTTPAGCPLPVPAGTRPVRRAPRWRHTARRRGTASKPKHRRRPAAARRTRPSCGRRSLRADLRLARSTKRPGRRSRRGRRRRCAAAGEPGARHAGGTCSSRASAVPATTTTTLGSPSARSAGSGWISGPGSWSTVAGRRWACSCWTSARRSCWTTTTCWAATPRSTMR